MTELSRVRAVLEAYDDESVQRVADATAWNRGRGVQYEAATLKMHSYDGDEPGCFVCHLTGNNYTRTYVRLCGIVPSLGAVCGTLPAPINLDDLPLFHAEREYMAFSATHGNEAAGRVLNAMAREVLASRHLSSLPELVPACR